MMLMMKPRAEKVARRTRGQKKPYPLVVLS